MNEAFSRTAIQLGDEAMKKLAAARVAVFGIGGVGGYAVEALARAGVGALDLIDDDRVAVSNLNRQIIATHQTIGQYKVDAAAARIASINPQAVVRTHRTFYLPEKATEFDLTVYDYVIDAIDTVAGKIALAEAATAAGVPLISCMGAGNKLDITALRVADISKTTVCPLARVMRKELGRRGIKHLKVVYSTEDPLVPAAATAETPAPESDTRPAQRRAKPTPGSNSFVPAAAGLILAGEVIRDLTGYGR
ncbi:MAG: tRNA threonylcarbamoyladenosine dehydratase [Clostridia bacterium]|nr:tRNA threonylcarbamoyladenosine dehydratase [Clostridia bacterium]